ncbi:kinesin-like protein KIN-14T [Euphorbia lathyris]|uniref:kinesin-like protein KIN-14T n=1 Tax=Euphorbia lathyris TaxID=212925 RepID=UPI00331401B6
MSSTKSVAEILHVLLGLNPNLNLTWVNSVSDIIKAQKQKQEDQQFLNSISITKEQLAALTTHLKELKIQRKQLLNEFLDLKGNIRVFCRIRAVENLGGLRTLTVADSSNIFLKLDNRKSKSYSFDRVFHPASSQDEVFSEIEPVIKSSLDGYNACIFAYGQTATGKTFTMEGRGDAPGVVPRTFKAIFKEVEESKHSFVINLSMVEIYMGSLKDLLTTPTHSIPPSLSVQTNLDGGVEIENLVSIQVNDFHQALRLYRFGCRFRSTASTNSNATSSRSHCMIRIAITCFNTPERRRHMNKIWLVDLGGSERVLKTKASGRRFDEGKAINLSLSALGDVINALQRKKHHIPFRNSKLTQVLKDSLGDDSKTLMLVHVSPKEEDLCETICSLNFATRVKNIHLGNDDTIEVQEKKEVAMANLQQQMTEIEREQLHVKKEIVKLENRLENLTGKSLFSEEQVEAYNFTEHRNGDTTVAPMSMLPSFMRPTVCSQRKSGTSYQSSGVPVSGRRRTASHRAESVTLPVKDYSDCISGHSISSCLVGLNMRNSADNATEYSQDTSESDVKLQDLPEQRKPTSASSQIAETSHIQENADRQMNRINYNKISRVDHWVDLQKNGTSTSGYNHRTKRIIAIPMPKKKHMQKENGKAQKNSDEKAYSFYDFKMHEVKSNNEKYISVTDEELGKSASEVETDKPLTMLNDLFNGDLRCNFISASQTTEGKKTLHTQKSIGESSMENDELNISSPKDNEHNGRDEAHAFSIIQADEGKKQISDSIQLNIQEVCELVQPDIDGGITWPKGDSGSSISMSEELGYQQEHNEPVAENAEGKDSDFSVQPPIKERTRDMLHLRSQKSLFTNYSNQKELNKQFNKLQGEKNNRGICHFLIQKLEILLASALLGLGFCSLGYEHEFFYSLEL